MPVLDDGVDGDSRKRTGELAISNRTCGRSLAGEKAPLSKATGSWRSCPADAMIMMGGRNGGAGLIAERIQMKSCRQG